MHYLSKFTILCLNLTGLLLFDSCQSHLLPSGTCHFTPLYFPSKTQEKFQPLDAAAIFAHIKRKAKKNIKERLDPQGCISALDVVGSYCRGLAEIGDLRNRFKGSWGPIKSKLFELF